MARQKFKITYEDGRVLEAKITPKSEVATEKYFKIGLGAFKDDPHAEHLYYMAWAALHYSGQEPKNFDDFLDLIEDIEPVVEGDTPVERAEALETDPFTKDHSSETLSS